MKSGQRGQTPASLAEAEPESDQLGNGLGIDDGFLDVIGDAGEVFGVLQETVEEFE